MPLPLMRWILRSASQRSLILLAAAAESRGNTFVLLLSGFTHLCIMKHFQTALLIYEVEIFVLWVQRWNTETAVEVFNTAATFLHPLPTESTKLSLSLFIPTASPHSINTRPKIRLPQTWSFIWTGYLCHCEDSSLIYTHLVGMVLFCWFEPESLSLLLNKRGLRETLYFCH